MAKAARLKTQFNRRKYGPLGGAGPTNYDLELVG
jgi:hypothetical protein